MCEGSLRVTVAEFRRGEKPAKAATRTRDSYRGKPLFNHPRTARSWSRLIAVAHTCLHGVLGNRSRICLSPGGFDHTMSAPQMSLAMYAVGVILTKPSSGSSLVIQMWVKHHIPNTKRRHANRVLVLLPVHKLYPLPCCAFITTFSVANY